MNIVEAKKLKAAPTTAGIYKDLPRHLYDAIDAVNASSIAPASKSGRLYARQVATNFSDNTEALIRGRAFALKCEDPEGWLDRVEVGPTKTVTAKAFLQAIEETDKEEVILEAHIEQVEAMWEAVSQHPVAGQFWDTPRLTELTLIWTCPRTRVLMKGRIDWLFPDAGYHVDVKTIAGCTPWNVERAIKSYSYALKMAHYRDGIVNTGLDEFGTKYEQALLFVEPETLYPEVIVRVLSNSELDEQRTWIEKGVQTINRFKNEGYADWMVPDVLMNEDALDGLETMSNEDIAKEFING